MIEAIVLAAGEGKRLGAVKPLVSVGGKPALTRVLETLRDAGIDQVLVVLGHAREEIEAHVDLSSCRAVVNPDFETGMGGSLALGIRSLLAESEGFLVLHADMPYVTARTVRAVAAAGRRGARIAAPIHAGTRGFPVYFRRSCASSLLPTLSGDAGARWYVAEHEDELELIPVDDPGSVRDLDRPEDLVQEAREDASRVH